MEQMMANGVGERDSNGRLLPDFLLRWRAARGDAAAAWSPTDFLDQDNAIGATVAAGWLFNPSTAEYRGGVFLTDRFDAATVDEWFDRYPGEVSRIESVVNLVAFYDLFVNCEIAPYEDALRQLAADVRACWRGVLTVRYPNRQVQVEGNDGTDSRSYGPSVTFWTETGPAAVR